VFRPVGRESGGGDDVRRNGRRVKNGVLTRYTYHYSARPVRRVNDGATTNGRIISVGVAAGAEDDEFN